jgi:hypothetical protein
MMGSRVPLAGTGKLGQISILPTFGESACLFRFSEEKQKASERVSHGVSILNMVE